MVDSWIYSQDNKGNTIKSCNCVGPENCKDNSCELVQKYKERNNIVQNEWVDFSEYPNIKKGNNQINLNAENFVEQVKQKVDSTIVNAYKFNPVMKDAIVRLVMAKTAQYIKQKINGPLFEKGMNYSSESNGYGEAIFDITKYVCDDLI